MINEITLQNKEFTRIPVQFQPYPPYPPRRILVVEDEAEIRRLNAEVLKDSGYEVDTAEDGMTGWNALHAARHTPDRHDLLIADYNMPGLTGLELIQRLRATHVALPVIMAAGTLPMELIRDHWLQPVVTLPKPYSPEQLLGTVEAVLRTSDGPTGKLVPSFASFFQGSP